MSWERIGHIPAIEVQLGSLVSVRILFTRGGGNCEYDYTWKKEDHDQEDQYRGTSYT